jgi:putative tricarboxylic transport membrane protein
VRALRRVAAPLLGLAAALALLPATGDLDRVARDGQLGPGFWPRVVLAGLALSCLAKTLAEWRGARRAGDQAQGAPLSRSKLAAGIALILGYVAAAPWLGFPVATAAFVVAFMVLAGARAPAGIAAAALVGTVGLLYLFVKVVYLPLPKGDGPFEALTLLLYRALRIF